VGTVIELPTGYRYRLPTMPVTATGNEETGPLYDPTPEAGWSGAEGISWIAGVVALELDVPVVVRRTHSGDVLGIGLFSLKLGDRPPITGLTSTRVTDILGGCLTAVEMLRGR
jgi:hypothetical protein